ncbi:MAG: flagellar protein FlgN [Gammaproteobacteria bacterium]|nr:flagellar protein FlgN [Gammaproteobacteria bacterium]MDH5694545.1 flagellar protein FlgN [Gammaproteobacteria bacterium]
MTEFATQAQSLLEGQIETANDLSVQLTEEYELLKKNKPGNLQDIAQEKQRLVTVLEQQNKDWQALLNQAEIPITLDDIKRHLMQIDKSESTSLVDQFKTLGEVAKKIQQQNTVNGTVLNLRQEATHQILSLLYGAEQSNTYGPSGKKESGGGGGTIAEA